MTEGESLVSGRLSRAFEDFRTTTRTLPGAEAASAAAFLDSVVRVPDVVPFRVALEPLLLLDYAEIYHIYDSVVSALAHGPYSHAGRSSQTGVHRGDS